MSEAGKGSRGEGDGGMRADGLGMVGVVGDVYEEYTVGERVNTWIVG